jgi:ADP-dependent NAD(P)H-hydrate dehydratase / NAD(P)H-hydrate epimerase
MVLMELAGRGAAQTALAMVDENPGPVTIFCGAGNNGGDGLVVARYLYMCGVPVVVYMVQPRKGSATNESIVNKAVLENLGPQVRMVGGEDTETIRASLAETGLVIDALLGTGIDRPVEGIYQALINAINGSGKAVLAIDLPSGINSDTGQIMGSAVRADATVTFGFLKAGLLHHPGAQQCGRLTVIDIGLPSLDAIGSEGQLKPQWWLATADRVHALLPARPEDSHKGSFGRLLTIAGSVGMTGAAVMASKSALRAGCGLSVLATPKSLVPYLPAQEIIYKALEETGSGSISPKAAMDLELEVDSADALILGPGLSHNVETVKFVHEFLKTVKKPCVIDADGLNALSQNSGALPRDGDFVLTPHPKELSRLLGTTTNEIQEDRISAAQDAANKFNCTVVLKGNRTIIANQHQQVFVNPTGNAGMATAGAGDVLSGIIGGFLAQGMHPFEAATAGVYIHGAAGDMAAYELGNAGIIAGDIMSLIPLAISKLHSGEYKGSALELQLFRR